MDITYFKSYLSLVAGFSLGILLPLIVTGGMLSQEMLVFYIITLYSALRIAKIINSKDIKPLESTFYIFVYVFFGVAPLSQVLMNEFPWAGHAYNSDIIIKAGFVIIIGILFYELGLFLGRKKKEGDVQVRSAKVNLGFVSFLGVALCLFAVSSRGGFQNLFLPRNELSATLDALGYESTSSLILTVLIRVPVFITFLFALILYLDKENKNILLKSNFRLFLLVLFLGILTLITNNPISTSRYWVGTIYLGTFFTLIKWDKLTQTWLVLFILSLMLIIFPYADVFRNSLDAELNFTPLVQIMSGKGDYDSFQQVMNVIKFTSIEGFSLGMQLLGVLFFWVPRSIWPTKPIGTGATVSEALGFSFTNVSAPLWAEFYINFSIIGVILLFIIYGYVSARLQIKYELSKKMKGVNFYRLFVPIFTAYQLFLLRGDLLSSFSYLAPVFIFIGLGFGFRRHKTIKINKKKYI